MTSSINNIISQLNMETGFNSHTQLTPSFQNVLNNFATPNLNGSSTVTTAPNAIGISEPADTMKSFYSRHYVNKPEDAALASKIFNILQKPNSILDQARADLSQNSIFSTQNDGIHRVIKAQQQFRAIEISDAIDLAEVKELVDVERRSVEALDKLTRG